MHYFKAKRIEKAIEYCKYALQCGAVNDIPMEQPSLQYLAVNVIAKHNVPYKDKIPQKWKEKSKSNKTSKKKLFGITIPSFFTSWKWIRGK